ncbi:MAG: pantetheine-phosphate adenylyltransferase [Magnetococcales bacterium]|nr:pantetheine-phosphate adenylyltransferase [Magnetococcales bacterium]
MHSLDKKIAVYPGTFDPVTLGHVNIIERGEKLFDRLIVGVAENLSKQSLFSFEQRIELISRSVEHLKRVEVTGLNGLVVQFAQNNEAGTILRGLRSPEDFSYEYPMAMMNQKMAPDVESVFLMTQESTMAISSQRIKEIALFGGDVRPFVPGVVVDAMKQLTRRDHSSK